MSHQRDITTVKQLRDALAGYPDEANICATVELDTKFGVYGYRTFDLYASQNGVVVIDANESTYRNAIEQKDLESDWWLPQEAA